MKHLSAPHRQSTREPQPIRLLGPLQLRAGIGSASAGRARVTRQRPPNLGSTRGVGTYPPTHAASGDLDRQISVGQGRRIALTL